MDLHIYKKENTDRNIHWIAARDNLLQNYGLFSIIEIWDKNTHIIVVPA